MEGLVQRTICLIKSSLHETTHGNVLNRAIVQQLILHQIGQVIVEVCALVSITETKTSDQVCVLIFEVTFHESTNVIWVQHCLIAIS